MGHASIKIRIISLITISIIFIREITEVFVVILILFFFESLHLSHKNRDEEEEKQIIKE